MRPTPHTTLYEVDDHEIDDDAGLPFTYDDGGRSLYYKGEAGDCVPRAFAIYLQLDYKQVYDDLQALQREYNDKHAARDTRKGKAVRKTKTRRSVRNGTWKEVGDRYAEQQGLRKIRTGEGSRRMPLDQAVAEHGDGIYGVNRHKLAIIDGVVRDTYNSSVTHFYGEPQIKGSIWVWQR